MSRVTEIQELLDEHGVKYDMCAWGREDVFVLHYCRHCGDYLDRITVMGECIVVEHAYLTPEQAVGEVVDGGVMRTTTAVCVSSGVTGHCECAACGKSIDPWDGYCRHCGARITEVKWR